MSVDIEQSSGKLEKIRGFLPYAVGLAFGTAKGFAEAYVLNQLVSDGASYESARLTIGLLDDLLLVSSAVGAYGSYKMGWEDLAKICVGFGVTSIWINDMILGGGSLTGPSIPDFTPEHRHQDLYAIVNSMPKYF